MIKYFFCLQNSDQHY